MFLLLNVSILVKHLVGTCVNILFARTCAYLMGFSRTLLFPIFLSHPAFLRFTKKSFLYYLFTYSISLTICLLKHLRKEGELIAFYVMFIVRFTRNVVWENLKKEGKRESVWNSERRQRKAGSRHKSSAVVVSGTDYNEPSFFFRFFLSVLP